MRRVAIYIRVSSPRQVQGASLEDQEAACREYAKAHGWIVVYVYIEAGRSAFTDNLKRRPQFQEMCRDAEARRFDVILVYDLSRFARRQKVQFNVADTLQEQYKVKVLSATEYFDTETTEGWVTYSILAFAAELRSRQLSDRIRAARTSEAERGRHVGPVPVGYQTEGRGRLIRQAPYDALVIRACTLYAPGQLSPGCIAATLNAEGYTMPNGRPLIAQDVRRIVMNAQIYAGYVKHKDAWIPGQYHEPIIDNDLCTQVLATIARRGVEQDRRFVRTREPALLAGLVYCDICRQNGHDAKMHYNLDRRKNPPWESYRCKTKGDGGDCDAPYAIASALDTHILIVLDALALTFDGDWLEEALAITEAQLAAPPMPAPGLDPAKIHEKMRRLERTYRDGLTSDEDYDKELAKLRTQLAEASIRAPAPPRVSLHDVVAQFRDIPTLIRSATTGERRAVLSECVDQLYVWKGEIRAIRPTVLFEPALIAARDRVVDSGYPSNDSNSAPLDLPLILPARAQTYNTIGGAR